MEEEREGTKEEQCRGGQADAKAGENQEEEEKGGIWNQIYRQMIHKYLIKC